MPGTEPPCSSLTPSWATPLGRRAQAAGGAGTVLALLPGPATFSPWPQPAEATAMPAATAVASTNCLIRAAPTLSPRRKLLLDHDDRQPSSESVNRRLQGLDRVIRLAEPAGSPPCQPDRAQRLLLLHVP